MTDRTPPTDPDRDLFRRSVGPVKRLRGDRVAPYRPGAPARPRPPEAPPGAPDALPADLETGSQFAETLSFRRSGVRTKVMRRLARGQLPIRDSLDLHGQGAHGAAQLLQRFLDRARAERHQCVRIVHGKGRGSRDGRPVIKSLVNRWLRDRGDVLAFHSAPPSDGGTGAVYVLLSGG